MKIWHLSSPAINSLLALPETGMGFQFVEAICLGSLRPLIVFNSDLAVDISSLNIDIGDDPSIILNNGRRIIEALRGYRETIISAPQPHSFRLIGSRIDDPSGLPVSKATQAQLAQSSSLVKRMTLTQNRTFHRFSAFYPDKRINPQTGDFAAGTYATPDSEVPFAPTGFAAVGRFALPNNLPASYHYTIEAPTGTVVAFGTVAPAFGQAGGGVEAYFPESVVNQKVPPYEPVKLPDE